MDGNPTPFDKIRRGQESAPHLVRFELTETLTDGNSAAARLLYFIEQDGSLVKLDQTPITVHSAVGGFTGSSGDQGVALYWSDANRFEALAAGGGDNIVRFKLTGSLTLGGSAPAVIRQWNGAAYEDGDAITVKDYFGALGDPGEWQAPNGYYGFAVKLKDLDEYQILYMEHVAQFVGFTLTTNMTAGAANATFTSFWGGRSTGSATSVYDTQGLYGSALSGQKGIAVWDSKLEHYSIIDMSATTTAVPIFRFKITYSGGLPIGGSAPAVLQIWDGAAYIDGTAITVVDYFGASQIPGPGEWAGEQNYFGFCVKLQDKNEYQILYMERVAQYIEFQLTGPFVAQFAPIAPITIFWGGRDTANQAQVKDSQNLFSSAQTGDKGIAVWDPKEYTYKVLLMKSGVTDFIRFELYTNLSLGGTAQAKRVIWDGTNYVLDGAPFIVRDFTTAPGSFRGEVGYRGFAIKLPDRAQYEIVFMEQKAQFIHFELFTNLESGEADALLVDDGFWKGKEPKPVGLFIKVVDLQGIFKFGESGDAGIATYDDVTGKYNVISMSPGTKVIRFRLETNLYEPREGVPANALGVKRVRNDDGTFRDDAPIFLVDYMGYFYAPKHFSGLAVRLPDGEGYEPISIERQARRMEFTAISEMKKTDDGAFVYATLFYDGVWIDPESQKIVGSGVFGAPDYPYRIWVANSRHIFQLKEGTKGVAVLKPELSDFDHGGPDLGFMEIDWAECVKGSSTTSTTGG